MGQCEACIHVARKSTEYLPVKLSVKQQTMYIISTSVTNPCATTITDVLNARAVYLSVLVTPIYKVRICMYHVSIARTFVYYTIFLPVYQCNNLSWNVYNYVRCHYPSIFINALIDFGISTSVNCHKS
jgi:hypothetical protein